MTVDALTEALSRINAYYGETPSTEEAKARLMVYGGALRDIPDELAIQAMQEAFTVCRWPRQFLVDWVAAIRRRQSAALPDASDMWFAATNAVRELEKWAYRMQFSGCILPDGTKLDRAGCAKKAEEVFLALPEPVRTWAGNWRELVNLMGRQPAELAQYVKPGFVRAVEQDTAARLSGSMPLLPEQREALAFAVTRPTEQANNFLAAERPRRIKKRGAD